MKVLLATTSAAVVCCAMTLTATAAPISFKVGLPLQNLDELDQLFAEVSDPTHPNYLQFITDPAELANRFGASNDHVAQIVAHVTGQLGCDAGNVRVSAMRDTVTCTRVDTDTIDTALWDNSTRAPSVAAFPAPAEFVLVTELGAPAKLQERPIAKQQRWSSTVGSRNSVTVVAFAGSERIVHCSRIFAWERLEQLERSVWLLLSVVCSVVALEVACSGTRC